MNKIATIIIVLLLGLISCNPDQKGNNNRGDDIVDSSSAKPESKESIAAKTDEVVRIKNSIPEANDTVEGSFSKSKSEANFDSIPTFDVDNYPVTNQMFKSANYLEEPVLSFDGLWFSHNDQTLAIALYTDYHRYAIFHFNNNDIPFNLIDKMELHKPLPNNDIANLEDKKKLFPNVFPKINEIDASYFISNKGFQIGDTMKKAIMIYGKPDSIKRDDDVEILYWAFIGDAFYNGKEDLNGKPLAENSFGHQVRMYYKKKRLIAVFLHNDIP